MDLILWRHADAEEADGGTLDLERRLSPHGERQAARIASWLNRQLPDSAHILVSPAERAQRTAMKLERKFKIVTEIGPLATAEQVLGAAGWPAPGRSIVVVGHQPSLGRAAALAMTGVAADWTIRKGAAWWLRSRERKGHEQTVLLCVQTPEMV